MNNHNFGKMLRALMKDKGVSVKAASEVAEVAPSVIDSWRNRGKPKDYEAVARLAEFLGVGFDELLLGHKHKGPKTPPAVTLFESESVVEGIFRVRIERLKERN